MLSLKVKALWIKIYFIGVFDFSLVLISRLLNCPNKPNTVLKKKQTEIVGQRKLWVFNTST